jgi:hypothetical protein
VVGAHRPPVRFPTIFCPRSETTSELSLCQSEWLVSMANPGLTLATRTASAGGQLPEPAARGSPRGHRCQRDRWSMWSVSDRGTAGGLSDYARGAEAVLRRGFSALKFEPIPGPWRTYIPKDHIRRAVNSHARFATLSARRSISSSRCTGAWLRCTPSISPMRWRSSSPTGSKSPASQRTSRRWRRSAMRAAFRS